MDFSQSAPLLHLFSQSEVLHLLILVRETWTIKASDDRRITAAEIKYMRRRAGYAWTDYKTNA
jgi:hypothetical protein